MKVRRIHLLQPMQIPGPGTSKMWTATGQDGEYKGSVKHIAQTDKGYVLELARLRGSTGHHAGYYFVPHSAVEYAFIEYTPEERIELGFELSEAEQLVHAADTSTPQTRKAKNSAGT